MDSVTEAVSEGEADTDTAAGVTDGETPTILGADAWCYFHTTGDQYYNWDAAASVSDPQGPDTLSGGTLVALRDGEEVVTHLLACDGDAARCTTTFREDSDGILCEDADSYTFRFTVVDEDDHVSGPVEVVGRAE